MTPPQHRGDYHQETDEALMGFVGRSDEQALLELHRRHAGKLLGYVLRQVPDRAHAEEVVQDVFLRAWGASGRYSERRGSVRTWLFAICRNLCRDWQRRQHLVPPPVEALDKDTGFFSVRAARAADPAVTVIWRAWGEELRALIRQLSAEHQEVIKLVFLEGRTHREAAETLDLPLGTVKSRLHRALEALRTAAERVGARAWLEEREEGDS